MSLYLFYILYIILCVIKRALESSLLKVGIPFLIQSPRIGMMSMYASSLRSSIFLKQINNNLKCN